MGRPNILVILADDMGYSDIGCYGGEIPTPHIDQLAADGIRMTQFYNTARCSPSRASLLTGLHPHQTGIGVLTGDDRPVGYAGTLDQSGVTMAEALREGGYATYMSGKWHLTGSMHTIDDTWPTRRGFDRFFGTSAGGGNYWWPRTLTRDETPIPTSELDAGFHYTDAIADNAATFLTEHAEQRPDDPFFCYVAFTAPHWPLHAREADIATHKGRFDEGWDVLRERRIERQAALGLFADAFDPSDRDPEVPAWTDTPHQDWELRRMEVYAAQLTAMDNGIGRILAALERSGQRDDTVVLFLSDNGGCAEEISNGWGDVLRQKRRPPWSTTTPDGRPVRRGNSPEIWPGADDTFVSYGKSWANLSNTPFREYKRWVHEGGIATPLVVRWPAGQLEAGAIRNSAHQLTDILPTVLDITGVAYPENYRGLARLPLEGVSMLGSWRGEPAADRTLYWEHIGNAACRRGRWKLVRKFPGAWELYDLEVDRSELVDQAAQHPEIVAELSDAYQAWATRCGVIPRERIVAAHKKQRRRTVS